MGRKGAAVAAALPQMTRPHQEAERPQSRLAVWRGRTDELPRFRLPGGGVAVFDAAIWAEAYALCRPALNARTVRRSDECPCPLDSEIAEERRTYRGGLVPASMVVDQWRRWVNEIFLRWQSQVHCMVCNEKSRQRARIRQQSQLRLPGEELRLAAAWVRTGRAERAQVLWRYLTTRVLRDAMTCAAIKEEHARRTLPSESARSIRNQPTMRRCACPRGCAKAVHGDQQYCDYCFVESGFEQQPECDCEGCCGNRVIDWDFILVHSDESVVRLHPDWKSTKILVFVVEGHAEPVEIPQRGLEV